MLREVSVVAVDVLSKNSYGDICVLKEEKQVFANGEVKRRNHQSSLGEKIKPGEEPEKAVARALQEELGIEEEVEALYYLGYEETVHTPDTYPALQSSYHFHKYATIIAESSFKPEGYVERQPDKTNFYVWQRVYPTPFTGHDADEPIKPSM